MTNVLIGGQTAIEEGDERIVRTYTPSVQETAEEQADEAPDKAPISDAERQRLDESTATTFQSVFEDGQQAHGDRAETFVVPGEWVSPVVKQRRKQAMLLPPFGQISDLEERFKHFMLLDGLPEHVASLGQEARLAVGAATEAHEAARHPDNRRYAVSTAAKDAVVQEIAKATAAVGAFEAALDESWDEWFDSLTSNLDKQRADALKALRAAEKAYAAFRATVNVANQVAQHGGRWDRSWHSSTIRAHDLDVPIASIRDAMGFLEGDDDYASGAFLTAEYDGIPPHTLAKLKRGAEVSQPGSFAQQIYLRAVSLSESDYDARLAVETKHLIPFLNSNPHEAGTPVDEV